MNIVIDTNVVISGIFFGGLPRKVVDAVVRRSLGACATPEIAEEYQRIVREMIDRKQGSLRRDSFTFFLDNLIYVEPVSQVDICRDPDDNKFLACAKDAKAVYVVSGDKDLLVLREFEGIEILTVQEFCARYPNLIL